MLQWTTASERRFTRLGALNDARVLVANPYHGARRAVRAVLEPLGCVVIEAERPAEVLEAARRRRPHVLLLDAAMEREASSSMVGEIKSDPELFAIAIVLVGAHGDAAGALAAIERGAHDVLPDDADAFELAARVRAARRGSDMQELLLTRERELERAGLLRRAHRPAQPPLGPAPARGAHQPRAPPRPRPGAAHGRRRPLQGGQRPPRPRRRGHGAARARRPPARAPAHGGRRRPLRRRGVRHRAARRRRRGRRGGGRGRARGGRRAPADDRPGAS